MVYELGVVSRLHSTMIPEQATKRKQFGFIYLTKSATLSLGYKHDVRVIACMGVARFGFSDGDGLKAPDAPSVEYLRVRSGETPATPPCFKKIPGSEPGKQRPDP